MIQTNTGASSEETPYSMILVVAWKDCVDSTMRADCRVAILVLNPFLYLRWPVNGEAVEAPT